MASSSNAEELFLRHLPEIEFVLRRVARRLPPGHEDDFTSWVMLKLIESDYATIRKYRGESSFRTFFTVVVSRLALDYQIHQWGKWHASAEARRLGPAAMEAERIMFRDGGTVDDALRVATKLDPDITPERLSQILDRLPRREPRPQEVDIGHAAHVSVEPDRNVETDEISEKLATAVREALESLPESDQVLLRLHFGAGLRLAEIARMLKIELKPLYRRLYATLAQVRWKIERAGVSRTDAMDVLDRGIDLNLLESGDATASSKAPAHEPAEHGDV